MTYTTQEIAKALRNQERVRRALRMYKAASNTGAVVTCRRCGVPVRYGRVCVVCIAERSYDD